MTSNVVAELERRLDEAEDEIDARDLRLARIEDALRGEDLIPAEMVKRLLAGEPPVRVWREHRGLSLRELARRAEVSAPLLSEIERGQKDGSISTLARLARVLGVDLDDLVPWRTRETAAAPKG
jgi:DNA-binding XRE family transcriptional regulator